MATINKMSVKFGIAPPAGVGAGNAAPAARRSDSQLSALEYPLVRRLRDGELPSYRCDHEKWVKDEIADGSFPESMRVALSRQFARVIGEELGRNTGNEKEAIRVLRAALQAKTELAEPGALVGEVVDAIYRSSDAVAATVNVFRLMSSRLSGFTLDERLAIAGALMRESMHQMFSELFKPPGFERNTMTVTGDGTFNTVFGVKGNVKSMSIRMVSGFLGQYFSEELKKAQDEYQAIKNGLIKGRAVKDDEVFKVNLTLTDGRFPVTSEFKTTKEGLVEAYLSGLIRYSSEGYPPRVRREIKRSAANQGC